MARPSKYNQSLAENILSRYADGETLTKICEDDGMPKRNTIYRWRSDYPEFGKAYQLALEQHVDALVDEACHIVDTEPDPQRAKVRADHRRWLASRLNRNKYGDKIEIKKQETIDMTPILAAAQERMKKIGVGDIGSRLLTEQDDSIEAGSSDTSVM